MALSTQKRLSLEEYICYDDGSDTRYELVDGVLIETGAENPINNTIAMFLISLSSSSAFPFTDLPTATRSPSTLAKRVLASPISWFTAKRPLLLS